MKGLRVPHSLLIVLLIGIILLCIHYNYRGHCAPYICLIKRHNVSATTRNPYNGLLGFVSVAGIMSSQKYFPFMDLDNAPSGNLNNIKTSGIYYLSDLGNYTNNPGFGWGILIVFSGLYTLQVAISSQFNHFKARIYDSNQWTAWKSISFS